MVKSHDDAELARSISGQHLMADELPKRSLAEQLANIHTLIRSRYDFIDRVALALYDAPSDMLKTFVSSCDEPDILRAYEVALAQVPSLQEIARLRRNRLVDDATSAFPGQAVHTAWLREHGYRASYTAPIYEGQRLVAFLFYDSRQAAVFTPPIAAFLDTFSDIICELFLLQRHIVDGIIATVQVAVGLAKVRDLETGAHLERMARYSRSMARTLAPQLGLSDEFIEYVYLFAPLHDIGKVGIPDQILLKPGPLDADEWTVMKSHVDIGVRIIDNIAHELFRQGHLAAQVMRNIVSGHHERGDGSGYPLGLHLQDIPIEARIVAVADVFDALSHRRVYKSAWTAEQVYAEMQRELARGRLDADCVQALLKDPEQLRLISERYSDPI